MARGPVMGRLGVWLVVGAMAPRVWGDAPVIEHFSPAGIARGTTNCVTAAGRIGAWPAQVWCSAAQVSFHASTQQGQWEVRVPHEVPAGAHWVRVYSSDGVSEPRLFVVGTGHETAEHEPNDLFRAAQRVTTLPTTINGWLQKSGDVDSYAVQVPAGWRIEARLDAYTLMGKVDAVLRWLTPAGHVLAMNHDFETLDPRLLWQAPEATEGVLQVMGFKYPADAEVRLWGGDGGAYRLHLRVLEAALDSTGESVPEREPNDAWAQAAIVDTPELDVCGRIDRPGDLDRFRWRAHKGEHWVLDVAAVGLGSRLDAWLSIENVQGKELARNDDREGSVDPRLEWTAAEDGEYAAVVGSLVRSVPAEAAYRLRMTRGMPEVRAILSTATVALSAGSTNELKVQVQRLRGFAGPLEVSAPDLPLGVSAAAVPVPEAGGEVVLKFVALPQTAPTEQPLRVQVRSIDAGTNWPAEFKLTGTSSNNGMPGGYKRLLRDTIDSIWLSVKAAPPSPSGKP